MLRAPLVLARRCSNEIMIITYRHTHTHTQVGAVSSHFLLLFLYTQSDFKFNDVGQAKANKPASPLLFSPARPLPCPLRIFHANFTAAAFWLIDNPTGAALLAAAKSCTSLLRNKNNMLAYDRPFLVTLIMIAQLERRMIIIIINVIRQRSFACFLFRRLWQLLACNAASKPHCKRRPPKRKQTHTHYLSRPL